MFSNLVRTNFLNLNEPKANLVERSVIMNAYAPMMNPLEGEGGRSVVNDFKRNHNSKICGVDALMGHTRSHLEHDS